MRKHNKEMIRFANSEEDTEIWYKDENTAWGKTSFPSWKKRYTYVVDDEYAKLRMESIDTGRPIQVNTVSSKGWMTPSHGINFTLPLRDYRLEPEQFEYPIYKKDKNSSFVIKFTGLKEGVIAEEDPTSIYPLGYTSDDWVEHTDTLVWEDTNFIEPTYYYQWEKQNSKGRIIISDYITDEHAEIENKSKLNWRKIESSKRTWEN